MITIFWYRVLSNERDFVTTSTRKVCKVDRLEPLKFSLHDRIAAINTKCMHAHYSRSNLHYLFMDKATGQWLVTVHRSSALSVRSSSVAQYQSAVFLARATKECINTRCLQKQATGWCSFRFILIANRWALEQNFNDGFGRNLILQRKRSCRFLTTLSSCQKAMKYLKKSSQLSLHSVDVYWILTMYGVE